jgi:BirA family transcriptional regulator, biotin operon repressor / biotin---[acetyl-CoA-carboxylase] ligase
MTANTHKSKSGKTRHPHIDSRVPDARRRQLLALLADGNFRSGEQLAKDLRVTRSAVWKLIGKLRALGVAIEAAPRQGYRLPTAVQLYDARKIRELVHHDTRRDIQKIDTLLTVDSTNRYLADAPAPTPGQMLVCAAELQTAGRGRRGRSWLAPFGSGICLSVAWQFAESPPEFSALSLAIGVAVVRALRRFGDTQVLLKWPNDLVANHRKLGGVLIDMRGEASGPARVVIGLGLNLRLPATTKLSLAEQHAALTTDLQELLRERTPDRNELIARILDEVSDALRTFALHGFAAFADEWRSFDSLRDRPVRVMSANETIAGVARGVSADGSLILDVGGQLRQFTSGDVSLRSATGA